MKAKASDQWHRFFTVDGETREFMYVITEHLKSDLKPHTKHIKSQGDLYRITKVKRGYTLWDARR